MLDPGLAIGSTCAFCSWIISTIETMKKDAIVVAYLALASTLNLLVPTAAAFSVMNTEKLRTQPLSGSKRNPLLPSVRLAIVRASGT